MVNFTFSNTKPIIMKKTLLCLCLVLASINTTFAQSVTVPFNNMAIESFMFYKLNEPGEFTGTLNSVTMNAILNDSAMETYAIDLTVYVTANGDINSLGLLQIGGYDDLYADQSYFWDDGDSDEPGTPVTGTIVLDTPLSFDGTTYTVWLGHGYDGEGAAGIWTGTLTLNGLTEVTASANDFSKAKFTVFPNPVHDVVTVANDANVMVNQIAINDINGRTVKTVKFDAVSEAQVNIADLNSGIYFMNITTDKGVTTEKIVKK